MSKPKMAIVGLLRGGIGHYIAQISPYLEKYFDMEYISYKYGLPGDKVTLDDPVIAERIKNKTPIFAIDYNSWENCLKSLDEIITFIKKKKIRILNIHVGTIARATIYHNISLITTARRLGIKILYTFHDVEPFEPFLGGEDLLKTFYLLADGGIIGNKEEFKKLISKYKFNGKKLEIATHGIYTIFDRGAYTKETARKHLGIPLDKKVILGFGLLRPYKRFEDMVAAMPKILAENPNAYLYISTGLRLFDASKELIAQAEKLGIKDSVKFVFEFVSSAEIEPIFKAADIVAMPYNMVSQSGIFNLAAAFGKPVIVSNLFSEAKMINNKMGAVVSPCDPDAIAEASIKMLNNAKLYESYQSNIKEYLKKDIWSETAHKYKIVADKIGK